MFSFKSVTLIALAALLASPTAGFAQPAATSPAPAPAPAAAAPAQPAGGAARTGTRPIGAAAPRQAGAGATTDVQTIGDWTVRCFAVKTPAPCDMIQIAISKEKKQRVSSVSLAYVPSRDNYATQIVVPLGVSFATGVTLSAGNRKIEGLKYRRCEHDGCYVETGLSKASIEALPAGGNTGQITIALYKGNKPINLPMSLNGFGQALGKLKELARAKAVAPAPAAAPAAATAPAPAPTPQQ
jgi:invasion protein IalB